MGAHAIGVVTAAAPIEGVAALTVKPAESCKRLRRVSSGTGKFLTGHVVHLRTTYGDGLAVRLSRHLIR